MLSLSRAAFGVAALLACTLVQAQVVSATAEAIELTVYRDGARETRQLRLDQESGGIAMVTETRTIDVPAGDVVLQFRGVADAVLPQSAKLTGLPATIREANFDYNLLTPGTLLAKSLGRSVRLIRTNRLSGAVTERRGVLRSGPKGVVVDFNGELEALSCSGLDERLVFDGVPESLSDTPTLSMQVRVATAGRYRVQLSYLALGLDWSADYVARVHPDGSRLDLLGWVTLVNRFDTRFADAETAVVAGGVGRVASGNEQPRAELPQRSDECWPIGRYDLVTRMVVPPPPPQVLGQMRLEANFALPAAAPMALDSVAVMAVVSNLGDYKLYSLPLPTTVAPRQVKQVRMLERKNVRFERVYSYSIDSTYRVNPALRPTVLLRLENERERGLGLALPAGNVAVMHTDAQGQQIFAGENQIQDCPVGVPFDIEYGRTQDVSVVPTIVTNQGRQPGSTATNRVTVDVQIANNKQTPVVLEIMQQHYQTDFRVVSESAAHTLKDGAPRWTYRLKAGERAVLSYAVEHR